MKYSPGNPYKPVAGCQDATRQGTRLEMAKVWEGAYEQGRRDAEAVLLDTLFDMVNQHTSFRSDDVTGAIGLDSMAVSAKADAMEVLARYGMLTIHSKAGRRILATWNPDKVREVGERAAEAYPRFMGIPDEEQA